MAVESFLPPVVTRLSMNIDDFVSGVAKAKAALKALDSKIDIPVNLDATKAQAQLKTLTGQLKDAEQAQRDFADATRDATAALRYEGAAVAAVNPAITSMSRRLATATAWQAKYKDAISDTNGALYRQAAANTVAGFGGGAALGGVAAGAAGAAFRMGGWAVTGTALHWIVAGGAEILAVVVPALIALGTAAAVAAEGATNLYTHMSAVYTATEATASMFKVTAGQAIGLHGDLQKMQTAANPAIYGTLGSAIATVNEHFGNLALSGLQVTRNMQSFSAHVVTDFAPGGPMGSALDSFTGKMVSDLSGIMAVFGNLGHGTLVLAAQMPGLAEVLLTVLNTGTHLLAMVLDLTMGLQQMGVPLLAVAMGYEEFNRWGGLATRMLQGLRLTTVDTSSAGLGAMVLSGTHLRAVLQGIVGVVPQVVTWMARMAGSFEVFQGADGLASKLTTASYEMQDFVATASTFKLAGIAAAGIAVGYLVYKLVTAQSAAQKLGAAMQSAVMGVSNVDASRAITANMAVLGAQITLANQAAAMYATAGRVQASGANPRYGSFAGAQQQAITAAKQYNDALQQQQRDLANVNQGAQWVAQTFGGTLAGALILADSANVKLAAGITGTGVAAETARAQIASTVAGYRAMGQSSGEVGADMTALAIQSGLAGTQVSKLNSAWDEFMQNMTGGTTGLGSFVQSIGNMGTVVAHATDNLSQAKNINLTTGQFAQALTNFGDVGSQAWQNFGQVVGSTAPQIVDWLRIAGAEGTLQAPQFRSAVLGMVSSLTQFAAKSPVAQADLLALAQQADPNIKTWGQLNQAIRAGNISFNDTSKAVSQATIQMGNMAQVAANLGNVMNSNLINTLSQATVAASGVGAAMQKYEQDIMNTGTAAVQTAADRAALIGDLMKLGYSAKQAAQFIQAVAGQLNQLQSKTVTVTVNAAGSGLGLLTHGQVTSGNLYLPRVLGYASGTSGASPGWAWVGELGPELVRFRGGERVIPSHVATGYANGTGGDDAVHEINVYLDGRQIYREVAKKGVETQRRTGSNQLSKRSR